VALQAGIHHPVDRLVDLLAIPPPLYVGLSQTQRAVGEHAVVEAGVVDLNVPRIGAVDLDISSPESLFEQAPALGANRWRLLFIILGDAELRFAV
jgi:hypothetical protein